MRAASAPGERTSLRVVTLNLWGDHAPLEERLAVAGAGLRALAPDVVLLQEVRRGQGLDSTAERLAALLGAAFTVTFACAVRADIGGIFGPGSAPGEEGVAILSRHPVRASSVVELPDARPHDRRVLLSALVEVGEARAEVWCHTTHLHWRLADGLARERQVAAIDQTVGAIAGEATHVLGGDLNAAPDCDEIRFLCGRHTLDGRRTCWQDSFARVHPAEPGWTWARRNPYAAPLAWLEIDRRIDYLLVSPERRDGRGRVVDARLVLTDPPASDHYALLADLLI